MTDTPRMRHAHPPQACWCGEVHTHGEVFDLNVYGRPFAPDPADRIADPGPLIDAVRRALDEAEIPHADGGLGGYHISTLDSGAVRIWYADSDTHFADPGRATDRQIEDMYAGALRDAGFEAVRDDEHFGLLVTGWAV